MSSENWQPALERAQYVKTERSRLRALVRAPRDYRESRAVVARLLNEPHSALHSMYVLDLLLWTRRMYRQTARRLLDVADASEFQIVGRLTVRQRVVLAQLLRARDFDEALKDAELEHEMRGWL